MCRVNTYHYTIGSLKRRTLFYNNPQPIDLEPNETWNYDTIRTKRLVCSFPLKRYLLS